jgi:hypothetical protein
VGATFRHLDLRGDGLGLVLDIVPLIVIHTL